MYDPSAPADTVGQPAPASAVSRRVEAVAIAAAVLAIAVLVIVVFSVVHQGASVLSFDFFTKNPSKFGGAGGGIANGDHRHALIVDRRSADRDAGVRGAARRIAGRGR